VVKFRCRLRQLSKFITVHIVLVWYAPEEKAFLDGSSLDGATCRELCWCLVKRNGAGESSQAHVVLYAMNTNLNEIDKEATNKPVVVMRVVFLGYRPRAKALGTWVFHCLPC